MKFRNLAALATLATVVTLGLAACGSDADHSDMSASANTTTATNVAAPTSADFNDADVEFAQGMIPHHQQAVEMADIALDPATGASDQVKDLATRIKGAQDPEIQLMTGWLTAWGQPLETDSSDGHDMSTDGMMSADEMGALGSAMGMEFDTMWQEMMIRHHEGAIAMAEDEKENGSYPEAIALADGIIAAQQAEIEEMNAALAG